MSDKEEKARSMSETIEKKGFAVSQYILNTSLKANKKMSELGEKAKEKGWMQPKDKPAKISKKNQQRMDKAEKYVDIAVGGMYVDEW